VAVVVGSGSLVGVVVIDVVVVVVVVFGITNWVLVTVVCVCGGLVQFLYFCCISGNSMVFTKTGLELFVPMAIKNGSSCENLTEKTDPTSPHEQIPTGSPEEISQSFTGLIFSEEPVAKSPKTEGDKARACIEKSCAKMDQRGFERSLRIS